MQKTLLPHDTIVAMIKSVNMSNIFGKWNIDVYIPSLQLSSVSLQFFTVVGV